MTSDPRVVAGLERQFADRAASLREGARHIGWKVGFGAPASLDLMEIDRPLVGHLTDRTVLDPGAEVSIDGWTRGVVEFEIAVYIGSDLGPGSSPDEARAAVVALGPSIELADIDLPLQPDMVSAIVGGNIFHAGVLFGERDPDRAGLDLSGLEARILTNGDESAAPAADLEALTGPYPRVVKTVADTVAARGEMLRAGDVIITGSVIPPIPLEAGASYTFQLHPFDPITVRVAKAAR